MPENLIDYITKHSDEDKVQIGITTLNGYDDAIAKMFKQSVGNGLGNGGSADISDIYNKTQDVDTSDVVSNGFVVNDKLKQMWLNIGYLGAVPVTKDEKVYIASCTNNSSQEQGGNIGGDNTICPSFQVQNSESTTYKVGVLLDLYNKGGEYIKHFWPEYPSFTGLDNGRGTSSLSYFMKQGWLMAEIVIPNGSAATGGKVMYAQVIGNKESNGMIYFTAPLCAHSNFSSVFKTYSGTDAIGYDCNFDLGSGNYSAVDGTISGFDAPAVQKKEENGTSPTVFTAQANDIGCRVRLYLSEKASTYQNSNVPEDFKEKNYNTSVNGTGASTEGTVSTQLSGNLESDLALRVTQEELRSYSQKSLQYFGREKDESLMVSVKENLPFMDCTNHPKYLINKYAAPFLVEALSEARREYGAEEFNRLKLNIFSCAYRPSSSTSKQSVHFWGLAVDIDAADNPMTVGGRNATPADALFAKSQYIKFIDIMQKYGWMSLGDASSSGYDYMHFQWTTWSAGMEANRKKHDAQRRAKTWG